MSVRLTSTSVATEVLLDEYLAISEEVVELRKRGQEVLAAKVVSPEMSSPRTPLESLIDEKR
jgi:hypothetical protein